MERRRRVAEHTSIVSLLLVSLLLLLLSRSSRASTISRSAKNGASIGFHALILPGRLGNNGKERSWLPPRSSRDGARRVLPISGDLNMKTGSLQRSRQQQQQQQHHHHHRHYHERRQQMLKISKHFPPSLGMMASAGDISGGRDVGGGSASASRLQAVEAALQKWCDRATSMFPAWVLGAAALGGFRPETLAWFNSGCITAALATTMVCMGMTLTLEDFAAVARRPRPVMAGVAAQYTVMPLLGFLSGRLFNLPPALAAGVTLVGCCPGGTASNLVTLIADGDVALSVSMTTVSTLLAAVVTGPLTKFLVGALVEISAVTLMKATAQVVFLPVALGLLLNTRAKGFTRRLAPYTPLLCVALVAMICGSVVAANSSILLGSGAGLVGAVLTLHAGGFGLGYGGMRACGFTEQEARTTSIEVGMQNSALAVVLAQRGLSDPVSAIPGAVSATCHSLIGSALAAYWRTKKGGRKLREPAAAAAAAAAAVGEAAGDGFGDDGDQQKKKVNLRNAGGDA